MCDPGSAQKILGENSQEQIQAAIARLERSDHGLAEEVRDLFGEC
jgi:hypothetical protein